MGDRSYFFFVFQTYTRSVFDAESGLGSSSNDGAIKDRSALSDGLGLTEMSAGRGPGARAPILAEILRLSKVSVLKSETPTPTER